MDSSNPAPTRSRWRRANNAWRLTLFSETSPRSRLLGRCDASGLSHCDRLGQSDLRHIGPDHFARNAGMRPAVTGAVGVMYCARPVPVAVIRLCRCGAGSGEQDNHQQRNAFHRSCLPPARHPVVTIAELNPCAAKRERCPQTNGGRAQTLNMLSLSYSGSGTKRMRAATLAMSAHRGEADNICSP